MRSKENRRLLAGLITVALSITEVLGYLPAYAANQEEEYSLENTVVSSWDGGYQGELLLRNLSDREMTEWSIDFTSPNSISDYWGASFQLADTVDNEAAEDYNQEYHYTVEAVDYTGTIAPGEAITIGYIASGTADDSVELSVNYVLVDPDMTEENPANTENNSSNDENADGQQNPEQTAEPAGGIYVGDGYTVEVQIPQTWDQAYNAKLLITNTTGEILHNWGFLLDTTDEISGLYNAVELSEYDGTRLFKNAGYNQDIPAGGTVEVGYTAFYEESPDVPDAFALASFEKSVEQTDYSVELFVTDEWEDGATAEIVIENTSDQAIEDWEMEFDTDTVIHNVWDGVIVSHEGPHYVIRNADYAQNIGAGGCWTVGLQISGSVSDIENIKMSRIVVTDETEEIELDDTKDTDEDGIPDVYEELFGTNPEKKDTDGDDLNDYIEIFITGTDPTKYDSVITGVSDSDIDSDGDGVSNGDEITLGLDPQNKDSDYDLMSDGDEIHVYHTDPAKQDTDGDTLLDGEEIKIGLDPLNPVTFGVPDAEYVIEQTIESDSKTLQMINDKETAYQLSLEVRAAGYAGNMEVEESGYSHVLENESVIGMIPSFYYENKLEEMTISFHIADAYIGNELGTYAAYNSEFSGIKRLSIAYFSEELQVCLPIASQYDEENHVVYATVTKQGTYCLIDLEEWFDMLGILPEEVSDQNIVVKGGMSDKNEYHYYGGHTFLLMDEMYNWNTAEQICEAMGGHLMTINDPGEQNFLINELLSRNVSTVGYWIGACNDSWNDCLEYSWISEEIFEYCAWAENEPRYNDFQAVCVYDHTGANRPVGRWYGEDMSLQKYFICEWDGIYTEEGIIENVKYYDDHMYALVPLNKTWNEAKQFCEGIGGHLVSITCEEEQTFIENNILTRVAQEKYWIGGYTENTFENFKWVTGDKFDYINWRHGEPNFDYEKCVHLYDYSSTDYFGLWNNEPVGNRYKFLCEWDQSNESFLKGEIYFAPSWKLVPSDFGVITRNNRNDYDSDGLLNCEEIDFDKAQAIFATDYPSITQIYDYFELTYGQDRGVLFKSLNTVIGRMGEIYVVLVKSDPTKIDSDDDLFPDCTNNSLNLTDYYQYDDPNPLKSDVKRIDLNNDFFSVNYVMESGAPKNWESINKSNMSYGGAQEWFGKYGRYGDMEIFCANSVEGNMIDEKGCGIIAVSDLFMYEMYASNPRGFTANFHIPLTGSDEPIVINGTAQNVSFNDYIKFTTKVSQYFWMFDNVNIEWYTPRIGSLSDEQLIYYNNDPDKVYCMDGILPMIPPGYSLDSGCKSLWRDLLNENKYVSWSAMSDERMINSIKRMISNDIPVVYAYHTDSTSDSQMLSQFQFTNMEYIKTTTSLRSHYMLATAVLEYSDDVKDYIGHKTLLRTASNGNEIYIDWEEYCRKRENKSYCSMLYID